jgi:hypothetical protein
MFVKMLDGVFAGQIKDLRSDVAIEHIRQKRAERAFQDPAPSAVPVVAAAAPETKVHGKKKGAR